MGVEFRVSKNGDLLVNVDVSWFESSEHGYKASKLIYVPCAEMEPFHNVPLQCIKTKFGNDNLWVTMRFESLPENYEMFMVLLNEIVQTVIEELFGSMYSGC